MRRSAAFIAFATILMWRPMGLQAQTLPIAVDRRTVEILGTVGSATFSSSLQLTATQDVGELILMVSDLTDVASAGIVRDPIPASAIAIMPETRWSQLTAGQAVQVMLKVTPPSEAGEWSGRLSFYWRRPSPGELQLPLTLTARNRPILSAAAPGQLKVFGVRGESVVRTLLLRETANGFRTSGLDVVVQDLLATPGDKALSAKRIQVQIPAKEMAGGGWMAVPVTLDLANVPSGQYTGAILVTDDYHNVVNLPVEVSVKDPALFPVIVLVLGVLVGLGVSVYRARGKPHDELMVRLENVRAQINDGGKFATILNTSVEAILLEIESDVAARRWDHGNTTVERAEKLVLRWRQEQGAWSEQITRLSGLHERLKKMDADVTAIRELHRRLRKIDLVKFETTDALDDELTQIEGLLRRFEQWDKRVQHMRALVGKSEALPPAVVRKWESKLSELERRLRDLALDNQEGERTFADDLSRHSQEAKEELERCERLASQKMSYIAAATTMAEEMGDARAAPELLAISEAAMGAMDRAQGEQDIEQASACAENVWRGLWTAQHLLPLTNQKTPSVEEAVKELQA